MLSRFHTIPACHGRTDGRTELLYQYRVSVCWRAIKIVWRPPWADSHGSHTPKFWILKNTLPVSLCICLSARYNQNGWNYNHQTCHCSDSPSWVLPIHLIGQKGQKCKSIYRRRSSGRREFALCRAAGCYVAFHFGLESIFHRIGQLSLINWRPLCHQ